MTFNDLFRNKPDSKTIRNLSANLWSPLLETLGQWCQVLRGRVSCRPALPQAGSACESAGRAHGRRHVSSPPRALLLRVPEPRRRPSSFSAPCPGPVARCPLCRPAEIRALGLGPGLGRCCHPYGAQLEPGSSLGSCFLLSPLKGRSEKGKGACAKVAGVVLGLLEERPAAAVDRLAPFTGLYPRRSAEL